MPGNEILEKLKSFTFKNREEGYYFTIKFDESVYKKNGLLFLQRVSLGVDGLATYIGECDEIAYYLLDDCQKIKPWDKIGKLEKSSDANYPHFLSKQIVEKFGLSPLGLLNELRLNFIEQDLISKNQKKSVLKHDNNNNDDDESAANREFSPSFTR